MTPKKYKVWWPEQGQTKDDARVFEGFDHEHAAAEWADWYDHYSAEYSIVGGAPAEVQVLREDECAARAVLVTGQLSRTYSGHTLTANAEITGRLSAAGYFCVVCQNDDDAHVYQHSRPDGIVLGPFETHEDLMHFTYNRPHGSDWIGYPECDVCRHD